MARGIWGGVGLQGMSGSINRKAGGHTFSKNGIIRRRVVPTNPQTASQGTVRGGFASFTDAWGGLSLAVQQAWNAAAKSGEWQIVDGVMGVTRNPIDGKQLFMHLNGNKFAATRSAAAPITAVPTKATQGTSLLTTIQLIDDGSCTITYTGALASNETHVIEMSDLLPAGTSVVRKSALRFVEADAGASGASVNWTGRFGNLTPAAFSKYCFNVYAVNTVTGQRRFVGSGITTVQEA